MGLVTIRSDEGSHGRVMIRDAGSLAERAMVRLGGSVALALSGLPERGCGRDLEEARTYALEAAGGDDAAAEQLLVEWRAKTRELLFDRDRWREHGANAIALCERETLNGSELSSVLYWTALRRTHTAV